MKVPAARSILSLPTPARSTWLLLLAALAATLLVYWPALYGGFLFDDFNLLRDPNLHVTTGSLAEWARVALSQAGTHQFRALGEISFALNFYLTGNDPFWLKLTNVVLHLANGVALFLMLRELLRWHAQVRGADAQDRSADLRAAAIAAAWLLLPINFTAVAYVSQRLESLANLFVLLGLYGYLHARRRLYRGSGGGWQLWLGLLGGLLFGLATKESAALLPLYALCADASIAALRDRDGRFDRPALAAHGTLLLLPLIAGLAWLPSWIFRSAAAFRDFTIGERLLTEPRVLVEYLHWTLLPNLNDLTFYHDDLAKSVSLVDPPTTLAAIVALAALAALAWRLRRARPLFSLGVAWFFAAHLMTGTIIPLELVFEHRNYFASVGVLLALADVLDVLARRARPIAVALALGLVASCVLVTHLRALEWSHPLRLAYAEALKRPQSPRAQYELAFTLIRAAGDDRDSALAQEATRILERNAYAPASGIAPLQGLIYLAARRHEPINPHWWRGIVTKLAAAPPSQLDLQALIFLFRCQMRRECPQQDQQLYDAFTAALTRSNGNVQVMSAYGEFALRELHDAALAERMFRDAVAAQPAVPAFHQNLIRFYIATRQFERAAEALQALRALNHFGALDATLAQLEDELARARAAGATP